MPLSFGIPLLSADSGITMKTVAQIDAEIQDLFDEVEAILSLAEENDRELTDKEKARINEIKGHGDEPGLVGALKEDRDFKADIDAKKAAMNIAKHKAAGGFEFDGRPGAGSQASTEPAIKVPAKAKANSRYFDSPESAYKTGMFLQAVAGNGNAERWCKDNGVMAAHVTTDNDTGGYVIPEEFSTTIIRLVEEFGVFRQYAMVMPMSRMSMTIPRRTGGFTVYYPNENTAITESNLTFNQVKLQADTMAALALVSNQLSETEAIGLADLVAREFAYSFANAEDTNGFLGDGTSTYGGILGLENALAAGSIYDAASGNDAPNNLDLVDFEGTVGKLPMFPGIQPAWYMHKAVYYASCARLMDAAGGNSIGDLADGTPPRFLGYPVRFTQVMTSTTGTNASKIVAYFGDLSMAATLGSLRNISVDADASGKYFEKLQVAFRAYQFYDINVHERGTATAAGPIIGLKTAS